MRQFAFALICLLALAGCTLNSGTTGDTANDAGSAGTLLPDISGYTRTDAASITDAIAAAGGGASLLSGNLVAAGAITQIDRMLQCYRQVGAVAANVYTQVDIAGLLNSELPRVGAVGVINTDRVVNNFLGCAVGNNGMLSAQSAEIEPCGGSGTLVVNNENITYVYAATTPALCQAFQQHFDRISG